MNDRSRDHTGGPDPSNSEDDLWPGYVGFNVGVPHVDTPVGRRLMGPAARKVWASELEQHAKQLHEAARSVLQDERKDKFGTPQASAVIWCDATVDIPAMRRHLHEGGYYVHMASYYYEAPMA